MSGKRTSIIIIALGLMFAVLLLLLRQRADQPPTPGVASASARDGSFFVQVERPILSGRPIWEVPRAIFGDGDRELRFGDMSPGAKFGSVGLNHVELSADGWELVIESNGQGRVSAGTRLVFTLKLPDRNLKLNCRPAEPADGHFNTTAQAGSDKIDGDFFLRLPACKNAVSGKNTAGLPTFTVRGSFKGLPQSQRGKE
jgi:hypothetical protein